MTPCGAPAPDTVRPEADRQAKPGTPWRCMVTRTRTCCVSSSLLRRLTPQHFHTLWGQTAANLQAALAERSDAEIGLARRQIAIGEASLRLPLSAYTEFDR